MLRDYPKSCSSNLCEFLINLIVDVMFGNRAQEIVFYDFIFNTTGTKWTKFVFKNRV